MWLRLHMAGSKELCNILAFSFTKEYFPKHGCRGNSDNNDDDCFKMILQLKSELSFHPDLREMACEDHADYPGNTSNDIEKGKLLLIHLYNAGNDRRKCSDDRQESCKND